MALMPIIVKHQILIHLLLIMRYKVPPYDDVDGDSFGSRGMHTATVLECPTVLSANVTQPYCVTPLCDVCYIT